MKYFSMFSGIGGFELGILNSQQAYASKHGNKKKELAWRGKYSDQDLSKLNSGSGLSCIGYSEIDKYAIQIYEKHFKGHKNYGDCKKIIWENVEDFDILVGGFPCQSFSIAGKRGGFEDVRGTLFFEIARCLRKKQPRLFLLENVKGLLSHDKGNTFLTILTTLDELGYDCQWQVLNSKNFGVPQTRERVFIIGHLGEGSGRQVFPIGGCNGETYETNNKNEFLKWSKSKGMDSGRIRNEERLLKSSVAQTLSTGEGCSNFSSKNYMAIPTQLRNKNMQGRRQKENGEDSFTIDSSCSSGISDGYKIRRLTPTECERLQGFPDGWTEGISDSQRYKCLGNAVTVNVIEAIISKILLNEGAVREAEDL